MKTIVRIALIVLIFPYSTLAQVRNDAGLRGDAGAISGFFESNAPLNFPEGATDWWHLLDVRHSNPNNNMAMQFSGSFYDQNLFFRKTNNSASQPWSKVVLERAGKVGIGTSSPKSGLHLGAGTSDLMSLGTTNYGGGNGQALAGIKAGQILGGDGGILEFQTLYWGAAPYELTTKMIVMGNSGNVGIGTIAPTERLSVNGKIRAKEVKVENANWPDFVFEKSYTLPTLAETEKHIREKGHLIGVPSAAEVKANGLDLGDMNAKLLQKIEELTLYIIDLEKRVKSIEK